MARRILFVCELNAGRSPMAAALFASICAERGLTDLVPESAGLTAREGQRLPPPVLQALAEMGVEPVHPYTRGLTPKLAMGAELVITMNSAHRDRVIKRLPWLKLKTVPLLGYVGQRDAEVADPFGGGVEAYRACLRQMRPALEALATELAEG